MMDNKTFTFLIKFFNPKTNKDDEIQFCAKTKTDAEEIFVDWCVFDEDFKNTPNVKSIEPVFNQYDKDAYGEEYGTPEEYSE